MTGCARTHLFLHDSADALLTVTTVLVTCTKTEANLAINGVSSRIQICVHLHLKELQFLKRLVTPKSKLYSLQCKAHRNVTCSKVHQGTLQL
jgi:hypothetical protein